MESTRGGEMMNTNVQNAVHFEASDLVVQPDPDLADLIPDFLNNRRRDMADIETAIARGDFEFIRRSAHTLKGICRPYGFIYLETLSKRLEVAGQQENMEDVKNIAVEMAEYLDKVQVVGL
jgi:HPt (histidine-containing phosphotransfer) domain-containing protein